MEGGRQSLQRVARFLGRYLIAAVMIPVGVALGAGGLLQFAVRRGRRRGTRGAGA
jgi:hypothetical protein